MLTPSPGPDLEGLPATRAFVSHGVTFGIRSNDPLILEQAVDAFPPDWAEAPPTRVDRWYSLLRSPRNDGRRLVYELYEDSERLDEGLRLVRLLAVMDSAIRVTTGRLAPDHLFVHAGAVAWNGQAILLPGKSGAGKTTLVAALVEAGATYYSDEYAVLDDRGFVHPYARPLSVRQGDHRRTKRCAESDLGGRKATEPVPVGLVIKTRYRSEATWDPQVVSHGSGALALFANTIVARERPEFAFTVLSRAAAMAVSLEGDRGEADVAVPDILSRLDPPDPTRQGTIP